MPGEEGAGEAKEKPVIEEKPEEEEDEIDPLDAYMQEVQQVSDRLSPVFFSIHSSFEYHWNTEFIVWS